MALYQFKEFLDFNDIIDYFRDFKVYNTPFGYSEQTRDRIKGILLEFIQTGKLTPVFYYDGIVKESFEIDSMSYIVKAWICVNEKIIKELFFDNELGVKKIDLNIRDYLRVYKAGMDMTYDIDYQTKIDKMDGFIFMDTNRYKIEFEKPDFFDEGNSLQGFKTQTEKRMEILIEILDDMKLRAEQDPNANISLDDYKNKLPKTIKDDIWLSFDDLLYPKSQLDDIFNPNQPTNNTEMATLKTQLSQANKHIGELEQELTYKKQSQSKDISRHTTNATKALNDVLTIHWTDYNPKNPRTAPKQEFIIKWILENYSDITSSMALWIDRIARHNIKK